VSGNSIGDVQFQPAAGHPVCAWDMATTKVTTGVDKDHRRSLGRGQAGLEGLRRQQCDPGFGVLIAEGQFCLQPLIIAC